MLGACGDELTLTADILNHGDPGETVVAESSPLRLQSIEALENLSASDLPGDFAGYEIEEISWECTDTVEMSRLLLDIDATLISPTHQRRTVRFSADVGPDLVSVEYYPGGEWVPPHDNLDTAFYPMVERYRNYSDGTRIGPDVFYDYGHPLFYGTADGEGGSYIILKGYNYLGYGRKWKYLSLRDGLVWYDQGERLYDYDGKTYNSYCHADFEYNLNTLVTDCYGNQFKGEDLLPIYPIPHSVGSGTYCIDEFSVVKGNYYESTYERFGDIVEKNYIPSRLADMNDEDTRTVMNLCRDVPDISSEIYPTDSRDLQNGWYFEQIDNKYDDLGLYSKALLINKFWLECRMINYTSIIFYLQYLVIDGRIIHFDNLANDFETIYGIKTMHSSSKTEDGYKVSQEAQFHLYGEKFKMNYDLNIHAVNGPVDEYETDVWYSDITSHDQDEVDNLTRSETEMSSIPREDGKSIVIDRSLPSSLSKIKACRTIKKTHR